MAGPVPMSVVSSNNVGYPSGYVVIGTNSLYQQPQNQQSTYWSVQALQLQPVPQSGGA